MSGDIKVEMPEIQMVSIIVNPDKPMDEPHEPDYDEFGEYLESVTNLSENYHITVDEYTPEIYASDPDDAYPAEGEFEIEYCGNQKTQLEENYYLEIEKYYNEFEVDGCPIRGQFTLKDFLKDGCEATFIFQFKNLIGNGLFYKCRLLDYELV